MGAWLREVAGWVLLGGGVAAFAISYSVFLLPPPGRVIEAGMLGGMGFVVFRGGLHLLKVAVAARAAREAGREPGPPKPAGRGRGVAA